MRQKREKNVFIYSLVFAAIISSPCLHEHVEQKGAGRQLARRRRRLGPVLFDQRRPVRRARQRFGQRQDGLRPARSAIGTRNTNRTDRRYGDERARVKAVWHEKRGKSKTIRNNMAEMKNSHFPSPLNNKQTHTHAHPCSVCVPAPARSDWPSDRAGVWRAARTRGLRTRVVGQNREDEKGAQEGVIQR